LTVAVVVFFIGYGGSGGASAAGEPYRRVV